MLSLQLCKALVEILEQSIEIDLIFLLFEVHLLQLLFRILVASI